MPTLTLISYSDGTEVLVTTPELEPQMLEEYFKEGLGRDLSDYDKVTHFGTAVWVTNSALTVNND